MNLAIRTSGLHKQYAGGIAKRGNVALAGVDLDVSVGSAFGLIGPNGAGKTTLLKILLGAVFPTKGRVEVLGGRPEDTTVRARIGYLPERLHLPRSWHPATYLASVGRLKRAGMTARDIELVLNRVGLVDVAAQRIGTFSKGMRQRLGLAAALIGKPDLLVLDEPTDGIDPRGRRDVRSIIREEVDRGATVFLNSHLLSETERICDHFAVLLKGQVAREGRLGDLALRTTTYRVRFDEEPSTELASQLGLIVEGAGAFRIEAQDPAMLNAWMDRVRARGLRLVEVVPLVEDLEQVLMNAIERADA